LGKGNLKLYKSRPRASSRGDKNRVGSSKNLLTTHKARKAQIYKKAS
jgi:hypothetical protein